MTPFSAGQNPVQHGTAKTGAIATVLGDVMNFRGKCDSRVLALTCHHPMKTVQNGGTNTETVFLWTKFASSEHGVGLSSLQDIALAAMSGIEL